MNTDLTFRFALLGILLLVLSIGVYHRIRSHATRERLDRSHEGPFILSTLRPFGILFMLGLVAYLIHPATISWSTLRLPQLMRWAGVTICTAATALFIWTLRCLGRNLTDTVVTRREHTLITTGPYRWVRHPFYGSAALFIFGTSLLAENWFLLLIGGLVLGLLIIRTHTEEQMLLCRFGESYRVYTQRTGRFVPRIRAKKPEWLV